MGILTDIRALGTKITSSAFRSEQAIDKAAYGQSSPGSELVQGTIYKCVVESVVHPKNTLVCIAEEDSQLVIENCVWAAGIFSNLFGFRFNYTPPRGSHILVLYGGEQSFIIGGFLTKFEGDTSGMKRAATSTDEKKTGVKAWFDTMLQSKLRKIHAPRDGNTQNRGGDPLWDMVEGELEITNLLGVGATFLRHIAQLKAGELAKVECSLIDDMVRIVSSTYKHHSSFGDYKIYNDGGRLNVRWDGTNSDWETFGKEDPEEEKIEQGDFKNSLKPVDNMANEAKWRFSQFVGFLGDFVNMFVTDPIVLEGSDSFLQQKTRSGKSRVHLNEDGTVLISTVNEFIIEKTPRITVPLEQLPEHHKDGNKPGEEFLNEDGLKYLKNWDFEASGGIDNIHYCVYQVREYAKWLSNQHALAQFLRLDKDWKVPRESEVPEPELQGQHQKDKMTANKGNKVPEAALNSYATIKICKDGSIVLLDSYDNAVTLSKSGLQLSSHNNVQIESAGSINMVAGRDINMLARNSIDLTSTKGGLSLRGENFIQQYCRRGGIILETDQSSDKEIFEIQDNNLAQQDDPSRIQGVVLKSKYSHVRLESGRDVGIKAGLNIQAACAATFGISSTRFQVNDTFEVYPKSSSNVIKTQDQSLFDAAAYDNTPAGEGAAEEIVEDDKDPGLGYIRVDGFMVAEKMFTNFLVQYARNLRPMMCKDPRPEKIAPDPTRKFKPDTAFCHPFHVLTTNKKKFDTAIEKTDASKYFENTSSPKFIHRSIDEYGTIGSAGVNYQSLTQQALFNDAQNTLLNKFKYNYWAVVAESHAGSERGNPWPGEDSMMMFQTYKRLWEPDTVDPKDYLNKAESLIDNQFLFTYITT